MTEQAEEFNPGYTPVEYKVIVYPDPIDSMEGMFEKPLEVVEKERYTQVKGVLVDFSEMGFEGWRCDTPRKGDRVEFTMYAGQFFEGADGKEYKFMNDKDIIGFVKE